MSGESNKASTLDEETEKEKEALITSRSSSHRQASLTNLELHCSEETYPYHVVGKVYFLTALGGCAVTSKWLFIALLDLSSHAMRIYVERLCWNILVMNSSP